MWTARAIGGPIFDINIGTHRVKWVKEFCYLGYQITSRLGWGKMIDTYKGKIRRRIALIRKCLIQGTSSIHLRRVMVMTYILPLFSWLFANFPLFTEYQKADLSHFYFTCMRRTLGNYSWNDFMFASLGDEISLEGSCKKYWKRYRLHLLNSIDGLFLTEPHSWNTWRNQWLGKQMKIKWIYRSKRIVPCITSLERCLNWCKRIEGESTSLMPEEELQLLKQFPESFM